MLAAPTLSPMSLYGVRNLLKDPSMSDRDAKSFPRVYQSSIATKKSFPRVYRSSIAAKKVFRGSIDHRWRQKKFSTGLSIIDGSIGLRWTRQKLSTSLSDTDGPAKSFPHLYRIPIDPTKTFHAAIGYRWTRQKISTSLSDSDGRIKNFPRRYRIPMDPPKDFHASIGLRWPHQKDSTPLSDSVRSVKGFYASFRIGWSVRQEVPSVSSNKQNTKVSRCTKLIITPHSFTQNSGFFSHFSFRMF